jgi:hypothetical protein
MGQFGQSKIIFGSDAQPRVASGYKMALDVMNRSQY